MQDKNLSVNNVYTYNGRKRQIRPYTHNRKGYKKKKLVGGIYV